MQRFGEPEEIGELVLFICSDACEFMTADTIYVITAAADGGDRGKSVFDLARV
jgi:NAD(P)-dependent dehydrogenase (short-subunit alcohol dehydrogenase family)